MAVEYVFGYGSLASHPSGRIAELQGFRREWSVAMDNRRDLPGYKYYVTEGPDGAIVRPNLCVAFLDVVEDEGVSVNGSLIPVEPGFLSSLDERERNYRRIEVSEHITGSPGRVWVYAGSSEARERRAQAHDRNELVAQREYVESIESAFRAHGERHFDRYAGSTRPIDFPVLDLRRIDIR